MQPNTAVPLQISLGSCSNTHAHSVCPCVCVCVCVCAGGHTASCIHWSLFPPWVCHSYIWISLYAFKYGFVHACIRGCVCLCASVVAGLSRSIVFGRYEWGGLVFGSLEAFSLARQAYLSLTLMAIFCICHNRSVFACLRRENVSGKMQ